MDRLNGIVRNLTQGGCSVKRLVVFGEVGMLSENRSVVDKGNGIVRSLTQGGWSGRKCVSVVEVVMLSRNWSGWSPWKHSRGHVGVGKPTTSSGDRFGVRAIVSQGKARETQRKGRRSVCVGVAHVQSHSESSNVGGSRR